jgi:predicted nucleic acid-binding protein
MRVRCDQRWNDGAGKMIFADTDILIDILRAHPPALAWLKSLGNERIVISGFVCAELVQGCRTRAEQEKVLTFLSHYEVAWPDAATCERGLTLFAKHGLSRGLGFLDALIAQAALDQAIPLHTFNAKHYGSVSGLKTVAPYTR